MEDAVVVGKTICYCNAYYRINPNKTWEVLMYGSHGPNDPPAGLRYKWHSIQENKVPDKVKKAANEG